MAKQPNTFLKSWDCSIISPLYARESDATDEILLTHDEGDQNREETDHSTSHHDVPLAKTLELRFELQQSHSQRLLILTLQKDQRAEEVIPRAHKGEDAKRRQDRLGQRQRDLPVDAPE